MRSKFIVIEEELLTITKILQTDRNNRRTFVFLKNLSNKLHCLLSKPSSHVFRDQTEQKIRVLRSHGLFRPTLGERSHANLSEKTFSYFFFYGKKKEFEALFFALKSKNIPATKRQKKFPKT